MSDWLKVGVKVQTPKGIAIVERITEDDGVYTSFGCWCRSVLKQIDKPYMPKVGEIYALSGNRDACDEECGLIVEHPEREGVEVKVYSEFIIGNGTTLYAYLATDNSFAGVGSKRLFNPIKTEREKVVEWTEASIRMEFDEYPCPDKLFGYLHEIGALIIPKD